MLFLSMDESLLSQHRQASNADTIQHRERYEIIIFFGRERGEGKRVRSADEQSINKIGYTILPYTNT